jgi:hypothetical protein
MTEPANTRAPPSPQAAQPVAWDDNRLAAWARNWHWNDCAEDRPVDPSIYFRDMRMLKAFVALFSAPPPAQGSEVKPHIYAPDYQAMGDCRVCGHEENKPWHLYSGAAQVQGSDEGEHRKCSEGSADDLRAQGWSVAVHNDYSLHGTPHTFWLLTKDGRAIKGEGFTDADALNAIRALAQQPEHHGE